MPMIIVKEQMKGMGMPMMDKMEKMEDHDSDSEKESSKIVRIQIQRLDDDSFLYNAFAESGEDRQASFKDVNGLYKRLEDDLESPHMREGKKPPLGSGERFKELEGELKGKVENPSAVAAAVGRKKYGKEKFQKLAALGRKKAFK